MLPDFHVANTSHARAVWLLKHHHYFWGWYPLPLSTALTREVEGEQEPRVQGGSSEGLHICAATQNAVPPPSPLLIASIPVASPPGLG